MAGLFKAKKPESDGIEFWHNPERSGWLMKQGESQHMRDRIMPAPSCSDGLASGVDGCMRLSCVQKQRCLIRKTSQHC